MHGAPSGHEADLTGFQANKNMASLALREGGTLREEVDWAGMRFFF